MRGVAEAQKVLWDADVLCRELLDDEGFLATLGRARGTVITDEQFDALYPSRRGRPSHPPSVLAALLLAQLFYGVSDREAERRSRVDLSWKAALGLPLDHRGIPHACLAEFRARLLRAGMEAFLHDTLLAMAQKAGVVGRRRAVDSTGIADSVMTQDTVTLIRHALRRCLKRLQSIDASREQHLRAGLARDDYDAQGKPQIVWSDRDARAELITELFADATRVVAACNGMNDVELGQATELLAQVAGQDLETTDDGVQIRQGVAPERIISVVDPDARHGHRSRADRYDGYKLHFSVDLDSDLICAVEASKATARDATMLPALLDADPAPVEEVMADTAYGDGPTRQAMIDRSVELVAPAPPIARRKGLMSKEEFTVDLDAGTATCPAGHTVTHQRHRRRNPTAPLQFRFTSKLCNTCQLKSACTTSPRGRILTVGPHERLLQQARAERWTKRFRERYRERSNAERKAAHIKSRGVKLPWRGEVKARLWIKIRAAALNLDRLGRLGLLPA